MKILNKINSLLCILAVTVSICIPNLALAAAKTTGPTSIQYQAADGFNMTGILDIPSKASIKKKVPLVIFLHSLGASRADWGTFPSSVKGLGFATLNLDLRGHGLSLADRRGKKRYWPNFKVKEFSKYPGDVNKSLNYLKDNYPEINTAKVAIVGADIGADTAILAGSKFNRNIKTEVLISPSSSLKGIDTRIPLAEYGAHPILIVVSKGDRFSYYDSVDLIKYAQGKKQIKTYPFGGNGEDLLRFQPSSKGIILSWLKANLK